MFVDRDWGAVIHALEHESAPGGPFIKLAHLVSSGQLAVPRHIEDIVGVMVEKWERSRDPSGHAKYGFRYPESLLNLGILCKTAGGAAARQYNILSKILGLPVLRGIRYVLANWPVIGTLSIAVPLVG